LVSQQPLGHDVASHTHLVPLQCWPLAQAVHAAPPLPHALSVLPAEHVVALLQHPLAQDVAVHTHCPLPLHRSPLPHAWQLTPPTPQVPVDDVWHWPFASQQPLGQVVASHTHLPCVVHLWLAAHAEHCTPLTPQVSFDDVMHFPLEQQPGHAVPPQLQDPLLHVCPLVHEPHALPADPHVAFDWTESATHLLLPSQQPPGHEAGVQAHMPAALHACPVVHEAQAAPRAPHRALP